jgi:hypothetical protein
MSNCADSLDGGQKALYLPPTVNEWTRDALVVRLRPRWNHSPISSECSAWCIANCRTALGVSWRTIVFRWRVDSRSRYRWLNSSASVRLALSSCGNEPGGSPRLLLIPPRVSPRGFSSSLLAGWRIPTIVLLSGMARRIDRPGFARYRDTRSTRVVLMATAVCRG